MNFGISKWIFITLFLPLDSLTLSLDSRKNMLSQGIVLSTFNVSLGETHSFYPTETTIHWKVKTYTGKRRYSGSDAFIYIQFQGLVNVTKPIELDGPGNDFEPGATNIFNISAIDVGPVISVKLTKLPVKDTWFLEKITIENRNDSTDTYVFNHNNWVESCVIWKTNRTISSTIPFISSLLSHGRTQVTDSSKSSISTILTTKTYSELAISFDSSLSQTLMTSLKPTKSSESKPVLKSTLSSGLITFSNLFPSMEFTKLLGKKASLLTSGFMKSEIYLRNSIIHNDSCRCCSVKVSSIILIEDKMKSVSKELTVDPKSVSRYKRKKKSIPDNRTSAKAIGFVGVIMLITPFALIVVIDLMSLVKFLQTRY